MSRRRTFSQVAEQARAGAIAAERARVAAFAADHAAGIAGMIAAGKVDAEQGRLTMRHFETFAEQIALGLHDVGPVIGATGYEGARGLGDLLAGGRRIGDQRGGGVVSAPVDAGPVIIGDATLYPGDAYRVLPALSHSVLGIDPVLCMDPPYILRTSGGGQFRKTRRAMDVIADEGLDLGFDHAIINPLVFRSVVVFCHNDQVPALGTFLQGNYRRVALLSWIKPNPMPVANRHYQPDTEFWFHAWNEGAEPVGQLADKKRWIMANSGRMAEFDHPTVKPAMVMDKILRTLAGGAVVDPFMGSGSTGCAALKAGRRFIGIESNPKHFETACRRLRAMAAEVEAA